MIRDRGRIKWTAMMLPEHVKILRDWAKEDEWEKPKELDEQKLEEMNKIAQAAQMYEKRVAIHYYIDKHFETVKGCICKVDCLSKEIQIKQVSGAVQFIPLAQIDDIELLDE